MAVGCYLPSPKGVALGALRRPLRQRQVMDAAGRPSVRGGRGDQTARRRFVSRQSHGAAYIGQPWPSEVVTQRRDIWRLRVEGKSG
jgi:hypothetical protein